MPEETQIRELVRRAVSEMLDGAASAAPGAEESPARDAAGGESVALGADHGGWALKDKLAAFVRELGYRVEDCGTSGPESVDYPDFAHEVARRVSSRACTWGIVVDGAGIGSAMVANKVPGVRAALCYDLSSARNSREHNHANVLTLGAGLVGESLARQIVQEWLATPWGPGRHARRAQKIQAVEARYLCRRVEE
jgi:ribose 5-phosphate isomerase B